MNQLQHHPDCRLLSFHEERIMKRGGTSSNLIAAISSAQRVDKDILMRCLQAACATYDAPRTRFVRDEQGLFNRIVLPEDECPIELVALQLGEHLDDPAITQQVNAFGDEPAGPENHNWFRALLIHTKEGSSVIAISMPHIVSDAVSMSILIARIWQDYAILARGQTLIRKPPRYTLSDFAGTQRAWGETLDFEKKLDSATALAASGVDRIKEAAPIGPPLPKRPATTVKFKLSATLSANLQKLAQQTQLGLPTLLTSGAALAIAKLFGRREFCFKMPFANRTLTGSEGIVGFLSNDLPIFISVNENDDVMSFAKSVYRSTFSMMRFGAIPWATLSSQFAKFPTLQPSEKVFDEYLVNIIASANDLCSDDEYPARIYPQLATGVTTSHLKIWLVMVNNTVVISLKVGIEQQHMAELHYKPEFVRIFTEMVMHPNNPIKALVN